MQYHPRKQTSRTHSRLTRIRQRSYPDPHLQKFVLHRVKIVQAEGNSDRYTYISCWPYQYPTLECKYVTDTAITPESTKPAHCTAPRVIGPTTIYVTTIHPRPNTSGYFFALTKHSFFPIHSDIQSWLAHDKSQFLILRYATGNSHLAAAWTSAKSLS